MSSRLDFPPEAVLDVAEICVTPVPNAMGVRRLIEHVQWAFAYHQTIVLDFSSVPEVRPGFFSQLLAGHDPLLGWLLERSSPEPEPEPEPRTFITGMKPGVLELLERQVPTGRRLRPQLITRAMPRGRKVRA